MEILSGNNLSFGDFEIDVNRRRLLRDGKPVSLNSKTFDLLLTLVRHRGEVLSKEELLDIVWDGQFVEEANLTVHISALRKILGEKKNENLFIATIPRHGYRFIADLNEGNGAFTDGLDLPQIVFDHHISDDGTSEISTGLAAAFDRKAQRPPSLSKRIFIGSISLIVLGLAGYVGWRQFSGRQSVEPFQQASIKRLTSDSKSFDPALSADGKYVAYVSRSGGQSSIWIKDLATGSSVPVVQPSATGYSSLTFAPDGTELYYLTTRQGLLNGVIYRIPVFGGTPKQVAQDVWSSFALAPTGQQVAFTRSSSPLGHLVVANVDGSGERNVIEVNPSEMWLQGAKPAWSPDGERLMFEVKKTIPSGSYDRLIEVQIRDGVTKELPTPQWGSVLQMEWAADGTKLLITASAKDGEPSQLWSVAYPDGVAVRLTNDLNNYSTLSMTADSRLLVTAQESHPIHIWTGTGNDTTHLRQLTFGEDSDDGASGLYWTPDGRQMILASSRDGEDDLWVIDADGSNLRQLTVKTGGYNISPRVTSDGRYVVFASSRTGHENIWRMDPDGNNARPLTSGDLLRTPAVSPDGSWVYYTDFSLSPPSICRVSIDGGSPVSFNYSGDRIAVSPDGKLLAFQHYDEKGWRIGIMSSDGGPPSRFFDIVAQRGIVRWTPDSKALIYIKQENSVGNIWLQPLDGTPPKQLTHFSDGSIANLAYSADGKQLAIARGNDYSDVVQITDFNH